jgi:hypothetical protein
MGLSSKNPTRAGTPSPAADDNEPIDTKPPVVLWAGPVAVLHDHGSEGVIEVGWPAEDHAQLPDSMFAAPTVTARQDRTKAAPAPGVPAVTAVSGIRQMDEVANPTPLVSAASTSQPDGGAGGR